MFLISFSFETSESHHYIDLSRWFKWVMFCISLRCSVAFLRRFLRKSVFLKGHTYMPTIWPCN